MRLRSHAQILVIRQSFEGGRSEIVLSNTPFSGLMYILKSIENKFMDDESQKRANEVMQLPLDYLLSPEPKIQTLPKVDFVVVEKVDEKSPPAPKKVNKSKASKGFFSRLRMRRCSTFLNKYIFIDYRKSSHGNW